MKLCQRDDWWSDVETMTPAESLSPSASSRPRAIEVAALPMAIE
jgi:hypothetical protein